MAHHRRGSGRGLAPDEEWVASPITFVDDDGETVSISGDPHPDNDPDHIGTADVSAIGGILNADHIPIG